MTVQAQRLIFLLVLLCLVPLRAPAGGGPTAAPALIVEDTAQVRKVYSTSGTFEDVKAYVVDAITQRGMVINNVSHVSNMLQRTGKDLGDTTPIFVIAEVLEFCSATVSREMMEADPHNIIFCPYEIAVYVLPSAPDTVYIAFQRPPRTGSPRSRKSLDAVEELLDGIVKDAL